MARVWHNCSVHCWSCWWQGCGSTAPCTVGGVGGKGVAQLLRALLVVLVEGCCTIAGAARNLLRKIGSGCDLARPFHRILIHPRIKI